MACCCCKNKRKTELLVPEHNIMRSGIGGFAPAVLVTTNNGLDFIRKVLMESDYDVEPREGTLKQHLMEALDEEWGGDR